MEEYYSIRAASLQKQVEELTRKIEAVKDRCADEMSNFVPVKDILKALTSENQKQ